MISKYVRKNISRYFTKQDEVIFTNRVPSDEEISKNILSLRDLGIYLHIPFCEQICPYCPYNKELFCNEACMKYVKAVLKEIDHYAEILQDKPISTFYIGGGTPTTMIGKGIEIIIAHIYRRLNVQCAVHMESHPNHLNNDNLDLIRRMNVDYLSVGVEALQDHHLRNIQRPYSVSEVKRSIDRAVGKSFKCVNIDFIFDLPNQTETEIEEAGLVMTKLGIQQVATYPLFRFPYTRMGKAENNRRSVVGTMFRRRRLLKILESIFYTSDFERSSVWAFTKKGIDKYCSVTVPSYIGLGASGGSYLNDIFYVNTFRVKEYVEAIENGISPIALSIDLSNEMQMSGWLYWRIYETKFLKSDFQDRFNVSFDDKYGVAMKFLEKIGYLENGKNKITLTDKGTYWIHAFEDFFSIDYINKLWGTSRINPWPEKIKL